MTPVQLDFDFAKPTVKLPPCGRGLGPCEAIIERDQIRCITCGCVAPRNCAPRTAAADALGAVLNGFMQAQLKFMKFLRQQAIAPGASGK